MSPAPSALVAAYLKSNPGFDPLHDHVLTAATAPAAGRVRAMVGGVATAQAPRLAPPAKGDTEAALLGYQRALRLVHDTAKAHPSPTAGEIHPAAAALLDAGIDSAHKAAHLREDEFVAAHASRLPGGDAQAKAVYANAQHVKAQATHVFAAVRDQIASPYSRATLFQAAPQAVQTAFQQVPGFDKLFSSLDFCPCSHSASMIGPGAYFIDLMRITDAYITGANAADIPDRYKLPDRRPDLFELKVTAENCDTEIPFLTIVTEVLERNLAATPDQAYQLLATRGFPFNLPFTLPQARIRANLDELGTSLGAAGATLRPISWTAPYPLPPLGLAGEILGLGDSEVSLYTAQTSPDWLLATCYGVSDGHSDALSGLADVPTFLERTGLERSELDDLLQQGLSPTEIAAGATAQLYINSTGEQAPPLAITRADKNSNETLSNTTPARLRRISSFVRLSRALGWTFEELDWIIRRGSGAIDSALIQTIAQMKQVGEALGETSPIAVAALFSDLKTSGQGPGPARGDFFDQIFNNPSVLAGRDPYTSGSKVPFDPAQPTDWTVSDHSGVNNEIRSRLSGALHADDDDLTRIANWVMALNGATKLSTDLPTLGLLYRVARLPRLLGLRVPELLHLIALMYSPQTDALAPAKDSVKLSLDTLGTIADMAHWLKAQPFTVYELEWSLTARTSPFYRAPDPVTGLGAYLDSLATQAEPLRVEPRNLVQGTVTPEQAQSGFDALVGTNVLTSIGLVGSAAIAFGDVAPALRMATDAFTTPDIDSDDAATVIAALIAKNILVDGGKDAAGNPTGYLKAPVAAGTDLSFLFTSSEQAPRQRKQVLQILLQASANVSAIVDVLTGAEKHQLETALGGLATRIGSTPELVRALLPFASTTLTESALVPLLLTPLKGQPPASDTNTFVRKLAQINLIVARLNFQPAELASAAIKQSGFAIANLQALTLNDVRVLSAYKDLANEFQDSDYVLAQCVLSTADTCAQTGTAALATLTAWPMDQIAALAKALWGALPDNWNVVQIATLARCFGLAGQLSGDVFLLLRLNAAIGVKVLTIPDGAPGDGLIGTLNQTTWTDLTALADATLDAVNGRFRDADFTQASGRITSKLLSARRDALLGTVIWKLSGQPATADIKLPSDLYQYLLLDVEMSGCMTTSRVIQATAAVQLYMQRCRMGLESGVTKFPKPFEPIWWTWMSTYRIWEVNRKIFLFPENYVDPSLRIKITPPFATLKQRLQQSDLTDTAVEDAYREYFNQVDTLGALRLIDGYNVGGVDPATNKRFFTLWLFARTGTEPYNYYFRTFDGATWAPWQKIDHTVPAPLATPIYAFDTPYLFWSESSVTQGAIIATVDSKMVTTNLTTNKATTKFIRRRPDGSWSPPQALVSDSIVGYKVDYEFDSYAGPMTLGLNQPNFDLGQALWRKPIVLFTPASATIDPGIPSVDRLMTTLGFSLDFAGGIQYPQFAEPSVKVPDQLAYDSAVYGMASRLYKIATQPNLPAAFTGRVQFGSLQIVDAMANRQTSQLTLLNQIAGTPAIAPVAPAVDRVNGVFGFAPVKNELAATFAYDDYPGQSPASTPAPTQQLLAAVNKQVATAVNVKNQLGWFLIDNGDESFLVQADGDPLPTLTENMTIAQTNQAPLPSTESYLRINAVTAGVDPAQAKYRFTRLTTQTIPVLAQRLAATGLEGLLNIDAQKTPELDFNRLKPTANAIPPASATIDFDGAMGSYFREIFFHAPFLVAYALNAARRFDQAQEWLQYIFNPTAPYQAGLDRATDRFWNYLPFRRAWSDLATDLNNPQQIAAYNESPFDPDAIASLRPAAYAKATVMKYITNLLDWSDQLFTEFTRETVNEATNLYVMASDLLGPKPREVVGRPKPAPMSFNEMKTAGGGQVPEFLIHVENLLPAPNDDAPKMAAVPFNDINSYFCIPENDEFIAYWDRVAGQLYKIRHCMNIDGVVTYLPLLAPPLDVRAVIAAAAAAGGALPIDFAATAPIPVYRFEALLGRARGLVSEVMQLGGQVQVALEHQDAEQLEILRNTHEKALLDLTTEVRNLHIKELQSTLDGLQTSLDGANVRYTFYDGLIQKGLSDGEKLHLTMITVAQVLSTVGGVLKTMAGPAHLVPNVGAPTAMTYGGKQAGSSLDSFSAFFKLMASQAKFVGDIAQISAGYERRASEWKFQRGQADYERKQIQKQLDATQSQIDGARQELQIHRKTLAQNSEMAAFITGKFTSRELYQWLLGRLGAMYYQTYTLAYDLARNTERALQYELNTDQTFVQFGYWDNVHKGLTAGEGLQLALNRMDRAWLDGNTRAMEIRRTVSLAQLDPLALVSFRQTGTCQFSLTERLYDSDYPGHYARKIKSISVSIPAVVGPWQTINATLTQLSNQTVIKSDQSGASAIGFLLGADNPTPGADVLRSNWAARQQIALSSGLSDSGLFQIDFRDERYLPFEGTGAVSRWQLDMPPAANHIDFDGISDVIIEVSYTAYDGGATLRKAVTALLTKYDGKVLVSVADIQAEAWRAFLADHSNDTTQTLNFVIPPGLVPPHVKNAQLTSVAAILQIDGTVTAPATSFANYQITPTLSTDQITVGGKTGLIFNPAWLGVLLVPDSQQPAMADVSGRHTIAFALKGQSPAPSDLLAGGFINPTKLKNVVLVLDYEGDLHW